MSTYRIYRLYDYKLFIFRDSVTIDFRSGLASISIIFCSLFRVLNFCLCDNLRTFSFFQSIGKSA